MMEFQEGVRYVTNSELSTHRDCRRKWWLSFHRKLKPKQEQITGPMALGTRVHHALQAIHDPTMPAGPLATYDADVVLDCVKLEEQWADVEFGAPIEIRKAFESEIELGRIMVEGYLEWLVETGADSGFEVVGAEQKVDVPFAVIGDTIVDLLGKMDLRVRRESDGARLFIDYKTCGSISQRLQMIHMETQFLHYQLLERLYGIENGLTEMTQGSLVGLLRKVKRTAQAKPPFYERVEVHHSDVELRSYYGRVYSQISEILKLEAALNKDKLMVWTDHQPSQSALIAYPTPTRDCTWKCPFKTVCPMFDDGSDAEGYLADHFVKYDPLTRYDDTLETSSDE